MISVKRSSTESKRKWAAASTPWQSNIHRVVAGQTNDQEKAKPTSGKKAISKGGWGLFLALYAAAAAGFSLFASVQDWHTHN